jgi:uncharacterized protein
VQALRRTDRELTSRRDIDALLARAPVGRVGVIADGEPYVVPMNFAHAGGRVVIHGADSGRLIGALHADARVCFEVDEHLRTLPDPVLCSYDTAYLSVVAFGRARVLEDVDERTEALRLLAAKYAPERDPRRLRPRTVEDFRAASTGSRTSVIEIELERVTAKRGGAP